MKRRGAFTFAETLAAMAFAAFVVPVAIHAVVIANRAGVAAERKRVAADLARHCLTDIVVGGDWRDADKRGDFGEDRPGYRWQLSDQAWSEDAMREITVEVFYTVQDREYRVALATLVPETEETVSSSSAEGTAAP